MKAVQTSQAITVECARTNEKQIIVFKKLHTCTHVNPLILAKVNGKSMGDLLFWHFR